MVFQAGGQEQGVIAWRPLVMPAGVKGWFLGFFHTETEHGIAGIVTVGNVARFGREVAGLKICVVVRGNALFGGDEKLFAFGVVIRALAVNAEVIGVEGVTEPVDGAEGGAGLVPIAIAAVFGERADTDRAWVKKAEMLLLGKQLREVSGARRGEQICDEQFTLTRGFEAEVKAIFVLEVLVGLREEEMSRKISVIFRYRPRGGVLADFWKSRIGVESSLVGAADRAVFVEEEARAEDRPFIVRSWEV